MAETALIIGAVAAAASTAAAGVQASSAASAQSKASQYNADALHLAGQSASNTAAANEATSLRRSASDLGEQSAAFGEANIGTGGSAADVMKQSRNNAQLDALDIWYGGELDRRGDENAASMERFNSLIEKRNSDTALISGGIGAGTKLLMGGANAYGYANPGSGLGQAGFGSPAARGTF